MSRDDLILRRTPPDSEFSKQFIQGMLDRMAVSYHKYGKVEDGFADHAISALSSMQQRIDEYLKTGNTEFLIDAANFAMIEFMYPSKEEAFYTATDSRESPGRIRWDGQRIYSEHNLDVNP